MLQARSPLASASRARTSRGILRIQMHAHVARRQRQQRHVSRITATISSGWILSSRRTIWRAIAPASVRQLPLHLVVELRQSAGT